MGNKQALLLSSSQKCLKTWCDLLSQEWLWNSKWNAQSADCPSPQERITWRNMHSHATRSRPNNGRRTDLANLQNVSICTGIIKQHNSKAQNPTMCTVKKGRLPNSKIMTSCIPDKTYKLVLLNPSSYCHYFQKPLVFPIQPARQKKSEFHYYAMCVCTLYVKNKNFWRTHTHPKSNFYSQIIPFLLWYIPCDYSAVFTGPRG